MPLLVGVLLTVQAQADDPLTEAAQPLVLRAFDFETDIIARVNCRVDDASEPQALPSWRLLNQIAAVAAGKTITLTTEGARLAVTSGRSAWKLPLMHHDDFPDPLSVPDPTGNLSGAALRSAVERVAQAATDNVPENCKWMSVERRSGHATGTLELCATDRYRLHTAMIPVKWAQLPDVEVRVPAKKLAAIVKPLDQDVVGIGWTQHLLALHTDHVTITTTLSADQGAWIPWRHLFEGITGDPVVFDTDQLVPALKAAALVIEGAAEPVRVTLDGTEALLSGREHDADSAVPVDVKYDGPGYTFAVNPTFLLEAVDAVCPDGGEVQLLQEKPNARMGVGLPGQPPSCILMPMRLPKT
jgi:DNA polymerase-3 subunit beta